MHNQKHAWDEQLPVVSIVFVQFILKRGKKSRE